MPEFFAEVDADGLVETHIKQVLKLEGSEADSVMIGYQQARRELVDRISRYPRGTFTRQHLQGVLAQVNSAIEAMNHHLAGETFKSSYRAALLGAEGSLKEIRRFQDRFTGAVTPINLNAAIVATDTANLLVERYRTNLAAYGNDLYTQISNGLFSAAIGATSYDEVIGRVSQFFVGEEWKLHRIVRTELHHVFNVGKMNSMMELRDSDTLPGMKKALVHPLDGRTGPDSKYAASLNLVAEIDEPFEYTWNGNHRSYMVPPDRPNDRSILVPYEPAWGRAIGDSELAGRFPAA